MRETFMGGVLFNKQRYEFFSKSQRPQDALDGVLGVVQ